MKNIKTLALVLFLLTTLILCLASCGGDTEITGIEVVEGSYVDTYELGDTVDFSTIKVNYLYSDGNKKAIPFADLTIGNVSTDEVGTYEVTVSTGDYSTTITITVVEALTEDNYEIDGFGAPAFVTLFKNATAPQANKEVEYKNQITYRVGDDNAFIFLPLITAWDQNDEPVTLTSYRSISTVEILLEGEWVNVASLDADYVAIDEENSSYDFTELAIGKTFRLTVKPASDPERFSQTFEFAVVDGWNAYTAADLSRFDNTQNDLWEEYKTANGIDNTKIAGIVLHNSLIITKADLPAAYFYTADEAVNPEAIGTMKDGEDLYYRTLAQDETFAFYGNGFTIDLSAVTPVHHSVYGVDFSNATLFKIAGVNFDKTYSGTASCLVTDLSCIGNALRTNDTDAVEKGLGGLIFCKYKNINGTAANTILKSFFIGQFGEYHTRLTVDGCRIYDTLQDFMFLWSGTDVTLNNCEFKRTGGPGFILQHQDPNDDNAEQRIPNLTVNANCVIEAYVNGGEAWFLQTGFAGLAGQILAMSDGFYQTSSGLVYKGLLPTAKTFTNADGYMNCGYVLMSNTATAQSVAGAEGSVTVGDVVVSDKSEANTQVATLMAILEAAGQNAHSIPIFQSSSGAACWLYMDANGNTDLKVLYNGNPMTSLGDYIADTGDVSFFTGDYLTLYMNGMAIAFAYASVEPMPMPQP